MDTQPPDIVARLIARQATVTGTGARVRNDLGLSLREFAALVGVDAATLSRWERRITRPTGRGAERYGRLLDDLLRGDE